MNKYRNVKTVIDGIKFDSKKEATYYGKLKLRQRAGDIVSFETQISYPLDVNGVNVGKYIADFKIVHPGGLFEVVDVKGVKTPVYNLKKRLMKAIYGIEIKEV